MSMILIDEIGCGSFGDVYACRFEDAGKRFSYELLTETWAVKKIEKDESTFNNLVRELHSFENQELDRVRARELRIPYRPIVFYTEQHIWLVMEKFTISCDRWFQTPLTSNDIRRTMRALLKPLVYLHSKEIGHRDVKPKNMFVNLVSGNIVLGDFGSTSLLEGPQYKLNQVCTIDTRAPEFFQEPTNGLVSCPTTYRADIWSVGITLLCAILRRAHSPIGEVYPFENDHEYIRQMMLKKFSTSKDEPFSYHVKTMCGQELPLNLEIAILLIRSLVPSPLGRSSSQELLSGIEIPVTPRVKRRRALIPHPPASLFTAETIDLRSNHLLDGTVIPLGRNSIPYITDAAELFHYANLETISCEHPTILGTLKMVFNKLYSHKTIARIGVVLKENEEIATRVFYLICATIANAYHDYNSNQFMHLVLTPPPKKLRDVFLDLLLEANV
jgi:serine/threonine protein kinase